MAITYGTVNYNGVKLELNQLPYADTDFSTQYEEVDSQGYSRLVNPTAYFADAEDSEGNLYVVKWRIIDEHCDDESNACNWEDYTVRKL